jgi:hypothetical protein
MIQFYVSFQATESVQFINPCEILRLSVGVRCRMFRQPCGGHRSFGPFLRWTAESCRRGPYPETLGGKDQWLSAVSQRNGVLRIISDKQYKYSFTVLSGISLIWESRAIYICSSYSSSSSSLGPVANATDYRSRKAYCTTLSPSPV